MNIKREIVTEVMIDDKTKLEEGDTVKFIANNSCYFGVFEGVTPRGCLKFISNVDNVVVSFNVKPTSIKSIEIVAEGGF